MIDFGSYPSTDSIVRIFERFGNNLGRKMGQTNGKPIMVFLPGKHFEMLAAEVGRDRQSYSNPELAMAQIEIRLFFPGVQFVVRPEHEPAVKTEPVRVADYLVEADWCCECASKKCIPYKEKTFPIGQQPEDSVMVPNSEREVTE
jgi:hypothetical protein